MVVVVVVVEVAWVHPREGPKVGPQVVVRGSGVEVVVVDVEVRSGVVPVEVVVEVVQVVE